VAPDETAERYRRFAAREARGESVYEDFARPSGGRHPALGVHSGPTFLRTARRPISPGSAARHGAIARPPGGSPSRSWVRAPRPPPLGRCASCTSAASPAFRLLPDRLRWSETQPPREWRNGRRAGLRIRCPKGRGSSTLPSRTPSDLHLCSGAPDADSNRPPCSRLLTGARRGLCGRPRDLRCAEPIIRRPSGPSALRG
jgi:hypothetical protein